MTSQTVTLGGGCFWCLDAVYAQVRGVLQVQAGYSNGQPDQPSYEQVCTGRTGCVEVVRLSFDPQQISLQDILEIFFVVHDPTTLNRQGQDVGSQYRSGIYYENADQKELADALVRQLNQDKLLGAPVLTEVLACQHYWPAEDYHQDFFAKNPQQAYCLAVAAPKVLKFRQTFAHLQKP